MWKLFLFTALTHHLETHPLLLPGRQIQLELHGFSVLRNGGNVPVGGQGRYRLLTGYQAEGGTKPTLKSLQ